jgi:hypothetical protein
MLSFVWGVLMGFSLGYPLGLWAMGYTLKEKDKDGN